MRITMRLHVFILLFFVGSVFGISFPISQNRFLSTSVRILNDLQSLGEESGQSENMTSPDTSDMDDNIPVLCSNIPLTPGLVIYITLVKFIKTICMNGDNTQRILKDSNLLSYTYWIKNMMCGIGNILFSIDNPIFG